MGKQKSSTITEASERKSGRAVFDNLGRGTWEWQTATGVFEANVTHEQMQQLEASELSLADSNGACSEGRVWTRDGSVSAVALKQAPRQSDRVVTRNEYQTVLQRLLRRLSG
jgi:hypothetical protein